MEGNHELYEMIFSQTKRVNRIIEDILKLSRQQTATQQVLKLAEWMPSFLENYFQGHDIFLRVKTKPIISFDTHQLEQILINLINNGLRYSSYAHPHAYVEIDIYCADNDVIIDTLDDGNGVKAEELTTFVRSIFYHGSKVGQVWGSIYHKHFVKPIKHVYSIFLSTRKPAFRTDCALY